MFDCFPWMIRKNAISTRKKPEALAGRTQFNLLLYFWLLTLRSFSAGRFLTHLAELYDIETRVLNHAVKRNISRLPEDFMFQLNTSEAEQLVS